MSMARFSGGPLHGQCLEVGDPPPRMIDAQAQDPPMWETAPDAPIRIVRYWRCHDGWYRYPHILAERS